MAQAGQNIDLMAVWIASKFRKILRKKGTGCLLFFNNNYLHNFAPLEEFDLVR
jgi:hypothetical protein